MSKSLEKWLVAAAGVAFLAGSTWAAEEAKKDAPAAPAAAAEVKADAPADPKDVRDKKLRMTTLEQAFLKADNTRNALARVAVQQNAKVKAAKDDAEKATAQKALDEAQKKLQTLSIAMEVVFGVGNRRDYEYDSVKSTVYLRVGTVEEAFARAVRAQGVLQKFVKEQTALAEAEKDEAKKAEIQKKVDAGTKQWQLVTAALQVVFGVSPQRNYQYEPKNESLYLMVSDNEVDKLKADIKKLQDEKQAAGGAAPAPDAPKAEEKK